jgi:MFS family permease
MDIRIPIWLAAAPRPGVTVFASLYGIEAFSRALIAGVVPLEALALLKTAQSVSVAYTVVGLIAMIASFLVPLLMLAMPRRWIFTVGCLLMVAGPLLMGAAALAPFLAGLLFRSLSVVCINISLNLYVLDYISRKDFVISEPRRLAFMAGSWCVGPGLGVYLHTRYGPFAAFAPAAAASLVTLGDFWFLRMRDSAAVAPATRRPPNPLENVLRFLRQPRLRLAWSITFARSSFWQAFFIYPPLYIVQHGGSELLAGGMLSAGQALLFTGPLFGRLGRRHGLRRLIIAGLVLAGAGCVAAGFIPSSPVAIAVLFCIAAIGAVILDALGNIPFLRFVHPFERSEMTSVFRTYMELSQLLPAAAFAVLLTAFPIGAVFLLLGAYLLFTAVLARYLPRRF